MAEVTKLYELKTQSKFLLMQILKKEWGDIHKWKVSGYFIF